MVIFSLKGPHLVRDISEIFISKIIYHPVVFRRDPNDPMTRDTKDVEEFNWGETRFQNVDCGSRRVGDLFHHTVSNPGGEVFKSLKR